MARCEFRGHSNRGRQQWGNEDYTWSAYSNIDDNIVQFCRKAMKQKNVSQDSMWIDPVYFDDKYFRWTEHFFSEVGIALYPKITNLREHFKKHNIKWPKNKQDWEKHRTLVWEIVHNDIDTNINKGVKPIYMIITAVRIPDKHNKGNYIEKIISIKKAKHL